MTQNKFELVIIGAGPAGLAASIYASRYGVKHIIVGSILGGQISETHKIDNYPGLEDLSGFEFAQKWRQHAQKYGVEIVPKNVQTIQKTDGGFELQQEGGEKIKARAILLATGAKRRKLNIKGEDDFVGKGVSYCATCDGFFYKNKTVAVIGGSDSAAGAALYLSDIAEKVQLIYRKECLRCEPYWESLIKNNKKIEVIYKTNVVEIIGKEKIEKIKLDNGEELGVDGLFIEAGSAPNIDFADGLGIETDTDGYIKIASDSSTNIKGVWAAGDITDGSDKFRQVITAAAEGAIAARSIYNYLKKKNEVA